MRRLSSYTLPVGVASSSNLPSGAGAENTERPKTRPAIRRSGPLHADRRSSYQGSKRVMEEDLSGYPDGDQEDLDDGNEMLTELPPCFQSSGGIEDKEDFRRIVDWKASGAWAYGKENAPSEIAKATRRAFAKADEGMLEDALNDVAHPVMK